MTSVNIATTPQREDMFRKVVESFVGQTVRLNCYLDGYDKEPQWLEDITSEFRVVGCAFGNNDNTYNHHGAGKFHFTRTEPLNEPYLTVDDDINYPKDYVETMVRWLEENPNSIVGVHGIRLRKKIKSYFRSRDVWMYSDALEKKTPMHLLGTGASG